MDGLLGAIYPVRFASSVITAERHAKATLRLLNVGLISKLPLGEITSWQQTPDAADPTRPLVRGRGLA